MSNPIRRLLSDRKLKQTFEEENVDKTLTKLTEIIGEAGDQENSASGRHQAKLDDSLQRLQNSEFAKKYLKDLLPGMNDADLLMLCLEEGHRQSRDSNNDRLEQQEQLPSWLQALEKNLIEVNSITVANLEERRLVLQKELDNAIAESPSESDIREARKNALPLIRQYGEALRYQQVLQKHRQDYADIQEIIGKPDNGDQGLTDDEIKTIETATPIHQELDAYRKSSIQQDLKALQPPNADNGPTTLKFAELGGARDELTREINDQFIQTNSIIEELIELGHHIVGGDGSDDTVEGINSPQLLDDYNAKKQELRKKLNEITALYQELSLTKADQLSNPHTAQAYQHNLNALIMLDQRFVPLSPMIPEAINSMLKQAAHSLPNSKFKDMHYQPSASERLAYEQHQDGKEYTTISSYNPQTGKIERRITTDPDLAWNQKAVATALKRFQHMEKKSNGTVALRSSPWNLVYGTNIEYGQGNHIKKIHFGGDNAEESRKLFESFLKQANQEIKKATVSATTKNSNPETTGVDSSDGPSTGTSPSPS